MISDSEQIFDILDRGLKRSQQKVDVPESHWMRDENTSKWRFGLGVVVISTLAISVILIMSIELLAGEARAFSAVTILTLMVVSAHFMDYGIRKRRFWDGIRSMFSFFKVR